MDPVTLIAEARAAGLSLEVAGDKLIVRGPKSAEPIVRRLRAAKPDVLRALTAPASFLPLLNRETVREALGPDADDPHAVASIAWDVMTAVRDLEREIRAGVLAPGPRPVHGRPLGAWLDLDDVARLLRAWRDHGARPSA